MEISYTIFDLLFYLLLYAFLGWCVEVCCAAVKNGRFLNRGFLNLPLNMPCGIAAALLLPGCSHNTGAFTLGTRVNLGIDPQNATANASYTDGLNVIDVSREALTIWVFGSASKNEALINMLEDFGILEIAKTGTLAIERGRSTIYDDNKLKEEYNYGKNVL